MSPADRGLQIPERKDAPVVEDPAVVAGNEAKEAAAAFSAIAKTCRTSDDENTPEFVAADKRTTEADAAYADAPVTSIAGALAKMREIVDLSSDDDSTSLDSRHIKTVVAFLEGFTGAPFVVADDPAVVAFAELTAAWAAFDGLGDEEPGHGIKGDPRHAAAYKRFADARDAVFAVAPVSMAGVAAKVRGMLEHQSEAYELGPDFNIMAKSMLPFLEGAPPPAPKPDPVVALSAEWGKINEEVIAFLAAIPEGAGTNMGKTGHVPGKPGVAPEEKEWDDALDRRDAVERQILETPATSMRGVAVKIRLVTHCAEGTDLTPFYATPAREIDYEKECIVLECEAVAAISALRDAERLAGVS